MHKRRGDVETRKQCQSIGMQTFLWNRSIEFFSPKVYLKMGNSVVKIYRNGAIATMATNVLCTFITDINGSIEYNCTRCKVFDSINSQYDVYFRFSCSNSAQFQRLILQFNLIRSIFLVAIVSGARFPIKALSRSIVKIWTWLNPSVKLDAKHSV